MAMTDMNSASDHSLLWGYPVDFWGRLGIWALIIGAIVGVVALLLTAASAYILYRVADTAQIELASETKMSGELIASLNNETAPGYSPKISRSKLCCSPPRRAIYRFGRSCKSGYMVRANGGV